MNEDVSKNATNLQLTCNEPLTIGQLRGMDGQPVLLVFDFELEPMISLIECVQYTNCVVLTNNLGGRSEFYSDEELREYGIKAYAYHPVATDTNVGSKLKEWEPCEFCRDWHLEKVNVKPCGNGDMGVYAEVGKVNNDEKTGIVIFCDNLAAGYVEFDFCPFCGKPQTEEARTMLEKRLRGCE